MYDIFTYIWPIFEMVNLGINRPYIEHLGMVNNPFITSDMAQLAEPSTAWSCHPFSTNSRKMARVLVGKSIRGNANY